ncbi:MAG TPA: ATP-dependent Clp protease adapter ClpS [Spirochaetota bacterium]|nr:ATP-dependent Clp protease adapter ClpS [Spirochaetota bacterium]
MISADRLLQQRSFTIENTGAHASGISVHEGDAEGGIQLEDRQKLKEPEMYRVILHNDHYTTMDFVVEVLVTVFHMPSAKATQVMLDVHRKGIGVCGVYTYDIAVTKVEQVHHMAKAREYPLRCSYERA